MRIVLSLMILGTLAACGADGEPVQPTMNTHVTVNSNGAHVGANLGLHKGPFSIFLGL